LKACSLHRLQRIRHVGLIDRHPTRGDVAA
jgi:hypothetical protein